MTPRSARFPVSDAGKTGADDFRCFYERCAPAVLKALAATLGDDELARDATQEALARAWLRWSEVAAMRNQSGWLYRVGLNWARSRFRRLRREVVGISWGTAAETSMPDPTLAAALARLPVTHRAVLVLRFSLGFTVDEVARVLGVPAGTVKSRQHWALKRLRKELGDDG